MAAQPSIPQGPFSNFGLRETQDAITIEVDFEQIVRQQVREVAQATDNAFRKIIEGAYDAGYCAADNGRDPDPQGYVDALIERLKEA